MTIVLPDAVGSYDYAVVENTCPKLLLSDMADRSGVSDSTFA